MSDTRYDHVYVGFLSPQDVIMKTRITVVLTFVLALLASFASPAGATVYGYTSHPDVLDGWKSVIAVQGETLTFNGQLGIRTDASGRCTDPNGAAYRCERLVGFVRVVKDGQIFSEAGFACGTIAGQPPCGLPQQNLYTPLIDMPGGTFLYRFEAIFTTVQTHNRVYSYHLISPSVWLSST